MYVLDLIWVQDYKRRPCVKTIYIKPVVSLIKGHFIRDFAYLV
jgi:hypothetical protein